MKLNTIEKFLLLAKHPVKKRFIISEMHINYGIIGGILMEMSLENRIKLDNKSLLLENMEPSTNYLINDVSAIITKSTKTRKIRYWMTKLNRYSNKYKWLVLQELASKNLIGIEESKFLGFIPIKKSYLINATARIEIIEELRQIILFKKEISDENMGLLGLVEACKMHTIISREKEELKRIRKELKQMIKNSPIATTVDQTIREIQAAIIASVIASSAATTAATSG